MDEAAKGSEHQDIVVRQQSSLAEVDAALEVDGLEVAVEVIFVAPAIGAHALAVVAVEEAACASDPHCRGHVARGCRPWSRTLAIGERRCAAAIEQYPEISAAVEPGIRAL